LNASAHKVFTLQHRSAMTIYNGRYCWDGTSKDNRQPIAWFAGSYDLKIFACSVLSPKVENLKSHLCLFSGTGEGQSISASPEKFAKQICADFALELARVIWVEDHLSGESRYEVVLFTPLSRMGSTVFYRVDKRMPLNFELRLINNALANL
jgi:hypothetical protein